VWEVGSQDPTQGGKRAVRDGKTCPQGTKCSTQKTQFKEEIVKNFQVTSTELETPSTGLASHTGGINSI
jgi:hypothetical protein